jgi:hypothetical protein
MPSEKKFITFSAVFKNPLIKKELLITENNN